MYKYNVERLANDINIQLHNELAKDESVENLTDYNVDVMDMGDNLYSIRLNLVWTTMSMIANDINIQAYTRDIYNVTRMLMEHINNSKRGWSE
tara:strand:- start:72 stop:350 length:279 start_codon:yes stop_codon:yes gene_type:complete